MHTVDLRAEGQYLCWRNNGHFTASGEIAGCEDNAGGFEPETELRGRAGRAK